MKKAVFVFVFLVGLTLVIVSPSFVLGRTTPNQIYSAKKTQFEVSLNKISEPTKKNQVQEADKLLNQINLTVCARFEEDIAKMAALMEELKARKGIKQTRVAYGGVSSQIEQADYWVNFAAEAISYQKIQDYSPIGLQENNLASSISQSKSSLKSDLEILKGKLLKAKSEVKKALDYEN